MTLSWVRKPDGAVTIYAVNGNAEHAGHLTADALNLTGERLLAVVVDICAECVRKVEAPSP